MRPTFDRRLWILLYILLIQCIVITNQQNIIKPQYTNPHQYNSNNNNNNNHNPPAAAGGIASHNGNIISTLPAAAAAAAAWSISAQHQPLHQQQQQQQQHQFTPSGESSRRESFPLMPDDNKSPAFVRPKNLKLQQKQTQKCAKNCSKLYATTINHNNNNNNKIKSNSATLANSGAVTFSSRQADTSPLSRPSFAVHSTTTTNYNNNTTTTNNKKATKSNSNNNNKQPSQLPSTIDAYRSHANVNPATLKKGAKSALPPRKQHTITDRAPQVHIAHRAQHKEVKWHREAFWKAHNGHNWDSGTKRRTRRNTLAQPTSESLDTGDSEALRAEELLRINAARAKLDGATAVVVLSTSDSLASSSYSAATTAEVSESESAQEQQTFKATQSLETAKNAETASAVASLEDFSFPLPSEQPDEASPNGYYRNDSVNLRIAAKPKRARSTVSVSLPAEGMLHKPKEPIIIIDDVEEFDSGTDRERNLAAIALGDDKSEDYSRDEPMEPRVLPLRPVLPNPYEDEEMSVVYAEQHSEIRLMCEVDLDIATSMWYKNGQVVHAMDRTSRATDYRFIKEPNGALTITNVMLEDDGKWQCEAENMRRYTENARPVKLVVLDRPKPPYLLIDSRRLDAGNIFVPVKENSELNLACISEGGNPKPTLTWEVLLSPGVDRHAQKVSAEVLELEEVKNDKDKNTYKINGGAKSEARLPAVYRAHHNARILCVMEHPTLKIRQNASLLLDVQYTPSFAISRTPGFGYPLREGIEVSLKCDVDSNPPSTPRWQKDDGDTPVTQTGDGFLNFTSIRREHSGWYKCTSRHLNFQYSSIGYYLSVRYDSVDVTSEPDDQDISVAAASHNPNKGQLEVQLGGAVTLQCPQGSLGCWSHLDPVTARLRGLGYGLTTPTGQFSLKDVVYQDAGTYKCIGQSLTNKKKLEVLQTVGVTVKGAPTVVARNATPVAYPGSPLHLAVEFCANPPAYAARWLHGDRVFTPGNQYGSTVLAYGVTDLPTPYCKEARLTYVSMHERVPRTFYFIVSSPGGVAEAVFKVNFTMRYRAASNAVDDEEEELSEPEEIHFPVFGANQANRARQHWSCWLLLLLLWLVAIASPLSRRV